jgi:hypothetical protein
MFEMACVFRYGLFFVEQYLTDKTVLTLGELKDL